MEEKQIEVADGKTMNFKPSDVCGTLLTNSNFTGCGVQLIKEKVNCKLDTASGGHRQPLIWDGFNQQIRVDQTCVGTITRNVGADLKRNGQGIIEYVPLDEQNGYLRKDGCVGTLTTDGNSPKHNNRIVEYEPKKVVEFGTYYTWEDKQGNINTQCNRATNEDNCALTVACAETGKVLEKQTYRIRKLTPKECGRLMGVKDEDIDKMSVHLSNSKLYHCFGDAICVPVLSAIFEQML